MGLSAWDPAHGFTLGPLHAVDGQDPPPYAHQCIGISPSQVAQEDYQMDYCSDSTVLYAHMITTDMARRGRNATRAFHWRYDYSYLAIESPQAANCIRISLLDRSVGM